MSVLDRYKVTLGYVPLTTAFWADARREGKPTAPDLALDAGVILAGQAAELLAGGDDVVVATTNVGHLS